jgi:hypothetical protein
MMMVAALPDPSCRRGNGPSCGLAFRSGTREALAAHPQFMAMRLRRNAPRYII